MSKPPVEHDEPGIVPYVGPYQLMPELPSDEFERLKADIAERGMQNPLDVDENGAILDGHTRFRAWTELRKNEPPPVTVRPGLSEDEKRTFARKNNILRRHLTRDQKRQLIADQIRETDSWSDRRIADELGVSPSTVGSVRAELAATVQLGQLPDPQPAAAEHAPLEAGAPKRTGADGKARKLPKRTRMTKAERAGEETEWVAGLDRALARFAVNPSELTVEEKGALFDAGISPNTPVIRGPAPFSRCTKAQKRKLFGFSLFLAREDGWRVDDAAWHSEWLARNGFASLDEWLGEPGVRYRERRGWREPSQTVKDEWTAFEKQNRRKSLREIDFELAELDKERRQ